MNKRERMLNEIQRHGEKVNAIFNTGIESIELYKKLKRIENKAHGLAEDYCNGKIETDEIESVDKKILDAVDKILNFRKLGIPVFYNKDPRGYALKIQDDYVREHELQIHTDVGGDGILAPDF